MILIIISAITINVLIIITWRKLAVVFDLQEFKILYSGRSVYVGDCLCCNWSSGIYIHCTFTNPGFMVNDVDTLFGPLAQNVMYRVKSKILNSKQ